MKPSTIALIAALVLAVAASFIGGCIVTQKRYEKSFLRPDTLIVTKWERDTIYKPKDSIIYRTKLVYLPVHDTTETHDTTEVHDSVLVEVPIVENTYTGENYKATVRGFQPELVDIWVKQKQVTVAIPYRKRWGVTVGPQVGVGITPQGWQPYAGAGVTFGYSF